MILLRKEVVCQRAMSHFLCSQLSADTSSRSDKRATAQLLTMITFPLTLKKSAIVPPADLAGGPPPFSSLLRPRYQI